MAFTEKIKLVFDVDSSKGVRSLKDLRSSVTDADGVMGKLKAGATGLGGVLRENVGAAALGAGAALVAFGVKAVAAFTGAAKAAIDLSTATGLTTEEASKWIAIGDDFEVTAEALATGMGKISKTLDDEKWTKYGIATKTAGGQTRSVNDIFIDTIAMLGRVTNATDRAMIGQELFGKGYQSLTPILGKTSAEYQALMDQVSAGQTITESEARSAERMRIAQDSLHDALNDVTLAVGGMVAELAPAVDGMAAAVEKALQWKEALGPLPAIIQGITAPVTLFGHAADIAGVSALDTSGSLEEFTARMQDAGFSVEQMPRLIEEWHLANDAAKTSVDGSTSALDGFSTAATTAADAIGFTSRAASLAAVSASELAGEYNKLSSTINDGRAMLAADDAMQRLNDVLSRTPGNMAAVQSATFAAQSALLAYVNQANQIPNEKKMEIIALISRGDLAAAAAAINAVARDRTITIGVRFVGQGSIGFDKGDLDKEMTSSWAAAAGIKMPTISVGGGGGGGGGGAVKSAEEEAEDVAQAWDKVTQAMFDQNVWSLAQYRTYLEGRLGAYDQFTDGYNTIWNELDALNDAELAAKKELADEEKKIAADRLKALEEEAKAREVIAKRIMAAQSTGDSRAAQAFELGDSSLDEYRTYLQGRLASYGRYSEEYLQIWREINSLNAQEAKAQQELADAEIERQDAIRRAEEDAIAAADKARQRAANEAIVAANIGGATYATINTAADPNAVVNAIRQYVKNNGPIGGITP